MTAREAGRAALTLIKMGGEISAILTVGMGGLMLASLINPWLGVIGLKVSPGVLAVAVIRAYASMDTEERAAARTLISWTRGTFGVGKSLSHLS